MLQRGEESGEGGSSLLDEIEALSAALAIVKEQSAVRRRSFSLAGAYESRRPDDGLKKIDHSKTRRLSSSSSSSSSITSSSSNSSSIWKWKPLRALSHIRHRRFDCRFSLQIHSAESIPPALENRWLCVHWKRDGDEVGLRSRLALVSRGAAEFEETLEDRCAVYGSKGGNPRNPTKYQAKPYVLRVTVVDSLGYDLGDHHIDLTRFLPLTQEELEKNSSGRWSTTFKLSGLGEGGFIRVSFSFSLLDGDDHHGADLASIGDCGEYQSSSLRGFESLPMANHEQIDRLFLHSHSMSGIKVLHEVWPTPEFRDPPSPKAMVEERPYPEFTVIEKGIEIVAEDVKETSKDFMKQEEAEEEIDDRNGEMENLAVIKDQPETKPSREPLPNLSIFDTVELDQHRSEERKLPIPDDENEFLRLLGLESSSSSSNIKVEDEPDSPKTRLWRQFKDESLAAREKNIFDQSELDLTAFEGDFEVCSTRGRMLDDEEAEALMKELGLSEKVFEHTPAESQTGFGSPIELPHDDRGDPDSDCHPVRTKDGGFFRAMDPSIFKFTKNGGKLMMQASRPTVIPADMGSDAMEILQSLGSLGMEKLSVQARQLMPLEDIAGKTANEIARESDLDRPKLDVDADSVTLREIAPLALKKIDALSIEGLRIQSGMAGEDGALGAPGSQPIDEVNLGRGLNGLGKSLEEWKIADLENKLTVAFMVQLRDPTRDNEPVGAPMLALIRAERSDEHHLGSATRFKIKDAHLAGARSERRFWASSQQEQSGSRWLLANGMGRGGKHPLVKLRAAAMATTKSSSDIISNSRDRDHLWSISKLADDRGELAALSPSISRNPNIVLM
ncbi:protein PLASTID MOVEMENT IMPAIRED 1-RELATED 1-like [Wolffia australiana]